MEVRVYYEDTDCGGVVYYANYLKYFERARTHYLETHGLSIATLVQEGTEFRVTRAELAYRSPATYGEILVVETTVAADRRISLTFSHVIRERTSERMIVEGSATLVAVDTKGKIKRLPPPILEALGLPLVFTSS
ncbi:MAG: YbgC/FadM family acyl-CoA thioesterase [Nitrospirota bacterium]|jgi:acyl-CoA thioester hydrolase|nr:YbgC/FadM family acyl-CoA thioesterase [Nitrospirota bacterium]MDH4360218.1 YbgC/FadM family acyl-CoA thioesterase [Nitrospirota bacterium]MDH5575109.1 YbgC/FadM family acyl-CoA thioesterase [Nitrospirota bacterium]